MGRRVGDRRLSQQGVHQKEVIVCDVGHYDAEQIIPLARHGETFDDFGTAIHEILECLPGVTGVTAHAYVAEDIHAAIDLLRIDEAYGPREDAGGFERLDAAPA